MGFTAFKFYSFLLCFGTGFWVSVCRFLNSKHVFAAILLGGCVYVRVRESAIYNKVLEEFASVGWGVPLLEVESGFGCDGKVYGSC